MRRANVFRDLSESLNAEMSLLTERMKDKIREAESTLSLENESNPSDKPKTSALIKVAYRVIHLRRARAKYFPAVLFHERAWEMLLELFISCSEGRDVWVKDLISATDGSPTTAARWLDHLAAIGMITRHGDENDRRRVFVALTSKGTEAMTCYLQDIGSMSTSGVIV